MKGGPIVNRATYYNYIEEKLNLLSLRIKNRGKINLLDLHIHSENFFAELCNGIFDLKLINANKIEQNIEGIDLIDESNKVLAQVSATCTKQKIDNSLSKEIYKDFSGYNFKFISIAEDAPNELKKKEFKNPHKITFEPETDIWDPISILRRIHGKSAIEMRKLYELVRSEFGEDVDFVKVETNLANIVEILSKESLSSVDSAPEINEFAIEEKIEFNDLVGVRSIIDDYKIFYSKLDSIYSEFDKQGKNKSFSVFQEIKRKYQILKGTGISSAEIFYKIIDELISVVRESSNYSGLPFEEIQVCVDIIVVDAFVRCKIFENPGGYNHVITR